MLPVATKMPKLRLHSPNEEIKFAVYIGQLYYCLVFDFYFIN